MPRAWWGPAVIKPDPVTDDPGGMLLGFEAMTMHALLLQDTDQTFDQPILLRGMRGDELLLQAIAFDNPTILAGGEDQPIVVLNRSGLETRPRHP